MTGLVLMLVVIACEVAFAAYFSRQRIVDDHQPSDVERLAAYERRRGEYLAAERLRHARVAQAIDARASVQPKVTPRLP